MTDIKAGIYEHYKGGRYLVLGLARHTETDEVLVVYVPRHDIVEDDLLLDEGGGPTAEDN